MNPSPTLTGTTVADTVPQPAFITEPSLTGDLHRVSAIYPGQLEADLIRQRLIAAGFAASAVEILQAIPVEPAVAGSDEVLKDMVVDGAIGTAVGTGIGVVGTAILWASSVTLFVASPLIAPLAMLGWFSGLGGLVGAAVGAGNKSGKFSELVRDAIASGNVVLVAHTQGSSERELAKEIIGKSLEGRDAADASPTVSSEAPGVPSPS